MSIEASERTSQIHVRPIQDGDRGFWASYWKEYNTFEGTVLDAASPENTEARWRQLHDPNSGAKGIVAIVDAKPVGFAHYILKPETADVKNSLYMEDIYVSPAFSNRGIAKTMIEWQRQEANRENLNRFYWKCYDNNPNAQAGYDKIAKRTGREGVRGQIYDLDLTQPVGQKPAASSLQIISLSKRDYSQLEMPLTNEVFQVDSAVTVALPEPHQDIQSMVLKLKRLRPRHVKILKDCLAAGFERAREQEMLPHAIRLEIYQRTPRIDEADIGIGIQAVNHVIMLAVNPEKITTQKFQETLKRLIPHECNHVMRADYLGIPVKTVGDAIISEGFALKAEILAGFPPADYNCPPDAKALAAYVEKVLPALETPRDEDGKVYDYWMFGVQNEGDRRNEAFGGYPLGHAIIASYLAAGHSMHDAMRTPNSRIIDHWKSELAQTGEITPQSINAWASRNFHWVDASAAKSPSNGIQVRPPRRGMPRPGLN